MRTRKNVQPYWRPNFQIPETLPDIKVVRTDFLVNGFAIGLAAFLVFLVVQKEFRANSFRGEIEELEKEIRIATPNDSKILKWSNEFVEAARPIVEVDTFFEAPVLAHEVVQELVSLKPKGLIFSRVALSEIVAKKGKNSSSLEYQITMSGEVKALTILDDFKNLLSNSELFNQPGFRMEVDESLQGRNSTTGIFPYRLVVVLVPDPTANQPGGTS